MAADDAGDLHLQHQFSPSLRMMVDQRENWTRTMAQWDSDTVPVDTDRNEFNLRKYPNNRTQALNMPVGELFDALAWVF